MSREGLLEAVYMRNNNIMFTHEQFPEESATVTVLWRKSVFQFTPCV